MPLADDAELVSESEHQLQFMLDILSEVTDAYGQEVMVVGNTRSESIESTTNITIKNITLNKVSNFKYLGNIQNSRANISCEISARIQRLAAAFNKLDNKIFSNSKMNLRVKIKSYKAFVLSNGLYGCATWVTTAIDVAKLDSWQYRALRRIMGYTWRDFKSYDYILQKINTVCGANSVMPIELEIRFNRLRYLGHVERLPDHRLPKIMLHGELVHGKRSVGGQEKTYRSCVKADMRSFNIDVNTWQENSDNRSKWRNLLHKGKVFAMKMWTKSYTDSRDKRRAKESDQDTQQRLTERPLIVVEEKQQDVFEKINIAMKSGFITVGDKKLRSEMTAVQIKSKVGRCVNEYKEQNAGVFCLPVDEREGWK